MSIYWKKNKLLIYDFVTGSIFDQGRSQEFHLGGYKF